MDVMYRFQGVEFERDECKARSNVEKHGITFEEAVQIPTDTLASLKKVAERRDMSHQALLKLYIGQGLRQDLAKLFSDRVLETTSHVLARHIQSEEEISAIIREIQAEAVAQV